MKRETDTGPREDLETHATGGASWLVPMNLPLSQGTVTRPTALIGNVEIGRGDYDLPLKIDANFATNCGVGGNTRLHLAKWPSTGGTLPQTPLIIRKNVLFIYIYRQICPVTLFRPYDPRVRRFFSRPRMSMPNYVSLGGSHTRRVTG